MLTYAERKALFLELMNDSDAPMPFKERLALAYCYVRLEAAHLKAYKAQRNIKKFSIKLNEGIAIHNLRFEMKDL